LQRLVIVAFVILTACAPPPVDTEQELLRYYATPATAPWLDRLYACANASNVIAVMSLPEEADIQLRIGEPAVLSGSAFQIDTEDVLIVAGPQSPLQAISVQQAKELFASGGSAGAELWVFADGEDVQQVFHRLVMQNEPVAAMARIAGSPQQMAVVLGEGSDDVGILTRHWKAGDSRELLTIATVPVLAITPDEPAGSVRSVLACLQ
jgi:hypothetical protein